MEERCFPDKGWSLKKGPQVGNMQEPANGKKTRWLRCGVGVGPPEVKVGRSDMKRRILLRVG